MKFIDSHHHLWCPEDHGPDVGYVWLRDIGKLKPFGDPTAIQRNYLAAEFLGETLEKPVASVHVQCDPALPDPVRETAWISRQAAMHNHPIGIVGFIDLTSDDAEVKLEQHCKYPAFRGVRQIIAYLSERPDISFAKSNLLKNEAFRRNFGKLAQHNLSFDLQLYPQQMQEASAFFGNYKDITVVIDHCGSPYDRSHAGFANWQECIRQLATHQHIAIKLSGHGMYDQDWNARTLKPYFDVMLEAFGADRMMFGSNFPVDKLMTTYDFCLTETLKLISSLSLHDQQKIMLENAQRIYRPALLS